MESNRIRIYFRHGDVNPVAQCFTQNLAENGEITALGVGVLAKDDI